MDLLERAPLLDELDGVLATTTTGGRVVLLAGQAGPEGEQLGAPGSVWRALSMSRTVMHVQLATRARSAAIRSGLHLFQPWNGGRSPASQT